MSSETERILGKIPELSIAELLTLQETITQELRHKTGVEEPVPGSHVRLAHAYRRTREEIEASLAAIFTPEELAQIGRRDFTKMPTDPTLKPLSQLVIEDREDRI
ncbi:MAG TPA: hypothetical protein VH186_21935 [Chloroflexia bacterium]|nr:hypothetical protein [Chloroflexia bacterium]